MGFTVVRSIKQFLFGGNSSNQTHQQHRNATGSNNGRNRSSFYSTDENAVNHDNRQHRKVYKNDEGEYVDYEEVK